MGPLGATRSADKVLDVARRISHETGSAPRKGLPLLDTGVPGLNEVLGGGVPTVSLNVVAGGPGSGKTTLAVQILFRNASPEAPGLFVSFLGETSLKMLRYQQMFDFFEPERLASDVHLLDLSEDALGSDLEQVLSRITAEVQRLQPRIVVLDSFRSLMRAQFENASMSKVEHFVQKMSQRLTAAEATTFLIGEYLEQELHDPVFTVADGILWLSQEVSSSSVVRRFQVIKARGTAPMPGLHTMRITGAGVQVFPRIPARRIDARERPGTRLSTGIPDLDMMMDGGIPSGDSLVLAGPTGTGKTTFAMKFAAAGLAAGEAVVVAIFEEHPDAFMERASSVDPGLETALASGKLRVIYLRPLDLSVDETLDEIQRAVGETGAQRVVLDSISGLEMALAPAFRVDFRESLYRLIGALTGLGVTIFSTVEVVEPGGPGGLQLTGYQVSFLTDDILSQRYVEIEGELRKVLTIIKMRGSEHSKEFRTYQIDATGVHFGESLWDYEGILSGMPTRQLRLGHQPE